MFLLFLLICAWTGDESQLLCVTFRLTARIFLEAWLQLGTKCGLLSVSVLLYAVHVLFHYQLLFACFEVSDGTGLDGGEQGCLHVLECVKFLDPIFALSLPFVRLCGRLFVKSTTVLVSGEQRVWWYFDALPSSDDELLVDQLEERDHFGH